MTAGLRCARCGGPTTEGTAICTALRVAATPSNPTGMVTPKTAPADTIFCSSRCVNGNVARTLARATCKVCGKRWDRAPGAPGGGRDAVVYCSESCRGVHEKLLRRAAKDLAKDKMPRGDDLEKIGTAIAESFALQDHWLRRPPHLVELPDRRALRALRLRLGRLSELREVALADERTAQALEQRRASEEAYRAHRDAQAEADKVWRDELS